MKCYFWNQSDITGLIYVFKHQYGRVEIKAENLKEAKREIRRRGMPLGQFRWTRLWAEMPVKDFAQN